MNRNLAKFAMLTLAATMSLSLSACKESGGDAAKPGAPVADVKITPIAPPAGKKWEEVVSKTPEGGYRMGNPDAKVKIVEYASLTCSHCADFAKEATEELTSKYVASGQVSYELRNFTLNAIDMPLAAVTRCVGEARYFPLSDNVFASQAEVFANAQGVDQAAAQALQNLPQAQQIPAFAKLLKLDEFFKARGVSEAEINSCLANTAQLTELEKITTEGTKQYNITGTPTFVIDGSVAQLPNDKPMWESIQAILKDKLG